MAREDSNNILGRGTLLIGIIDLCVSLCWIASCTNMIFEKEISKEDQSVRDKPTLEFLLFRDTTFLVVMLVLHPINILFGIILLFGVYLGKAWLVLTWYIPNLVVIFIAFLACLILAFTNYAVLAMILPSLICFRAFETWIVGEFHWNLGFILITNQNDNIVILEQKP